MLLRSIQGNLNIYHIAMHLQGSILPATRRTCLYISPNGVIRYDMPSL